MMSCVCTARGTGGRSLKFELLLASSVCYTHRRRRSIVANKPKGGEPALGQAPFALGRRGRTERQGGREIPVVATRSAAG